jgi:colicin import membrane protein
MAGLEKIVTDERVFEIADRLTAEGRNVTNRLIWDHIGGGSMTTIGGALRRWRERQQLQAEAPAVRVALPEGVDRTMREAVERLWAAAQEETRREVERLTQAMNVRVAEAVAERDGALAELQSTVEELQGWQGKAAALEGELKDARQEAEQGRAGLASAAERAGQAEARAGEIERRADGLQAELGWVHEEAKAERERQAAAIAAGQGELDRLREELASLRATAQAEQRQHAEAAKRAKEQAERLADTLARAGIERDEARREAAEARENAARLQGQVEAMKAQQGELMKAIAAKAERPPSGRAAK